MGMALGFYTLSDENIARLLADPPLVWKVVAPDDPEPYEQARRASGGFFSRLLGRDKAGPPGELRLARGEVDEGDVDKAWHGLHFMLTGSAWEGEEPLCFLVKGGTPVGDVEVGYGPARALSAAEVRSLDAALRPIDEEWLRRRFDPERMMKLDIYPSIWDRDPAEDDTFGYCVENFHGLKAFVAKAASQGKGMVLCLM